MKKLLILLFSFSLVFAGYNYNNNNNYKNNYYNNNNNKNNYYNNNNNNNNNYYNNNNNNNNNYYNNNNNNNKNNNNNNTDNTTYESNSTDDFAVRPAEFNVSKYPKVVKAGSEFNLTVDAIDNNGSNSKDYNETLSVSIASPIIEYNDTKEGCFRGDLTGNDKNFSNGEANISLKYSEVGDLNLTIKEVNQSEFAKVDNDDTNLSQRLIKEQNITITFIPHHFEVNATLKNGDGDNNFTYYDNDLNKTALIELNITAQNEANKTTKNYNTKCYAKDIEVNVSLAKVANGDINVSKKKYYFIDMNNTKSDIFETKLDDPLVVDYNETNFTTENNGSTNLEIYFNFDKNISIPSSPMELNISEINVSDKNTSLVYLNKNDGNATFYYGFVVMGDVQTYTNEANETVKFVAFDDNKSDNLKPSNNQELYNWYFNKYHQNLDGNISNDDIVVSRDYNASNKITGIDTNVTSIKNGKITINIKKTKSSVNFAVIHILSPYLKWLWYNKFNKPYDISSDSDCMSHFCFLVHFEENSSLDGVGSGDFKGSEVNTTNPNAHGIRLYR